MAAQSDFEKWLDSISEEELVQQRREYAALASEYTRRTDEISHLIALRRRLANRPTDREIVESAREAQPLTEDDSVRLFPTDATGRPSLADGIQIVVRAAGPNGLEAAEILNALNERGWGPRGKTPINSIHATTSRLRRAGRLKRVNGRFIKTPEVELE